MPSSWAKALVVLRTVTNGYYRGISLLDIVGKVFCKVVTGRLEAAIPTQSEQAGFTAGKSCQHNLFVLMQTLSRRKWQGKDTQLFFLDVRKAFDTVWRDGLLLKLFESGVQGKLW